MFLRSATRAGLFAGAMALAAPAGAATAVWQVGPVGLAAGQVAEVGITDLGLEDSSCLVSVRVFAAPASRPTVTVNIAAMALVVDTFPTPNELPPGAVLVVGFTDPDLQSGEGEATRRVLTARVRTDCGGSTVPGIRSRFGVTMGITDADAEEATASIVLTGTIVAIRE